MFVCFFLLFSTEHKSPPCLLCQTTRRMLAMCKEIQKERLVIGNKAIYQLKSICHGEKGGVEEEKWRCLVSENVLFSTSGILGTQSISASPVGNVFVSSSDWQGTKSIMTYCRTSLYSVSPSHVLSLPRRPSERTCTPCQKKKKIRVD